MADLLQPKKLNYLEGLRGIAALMVLGHHFMLAFYPAMYDGNPTREHMGDFECQYYGSPLNVLTNGNFCVTIFFVLSGFVLSHKYLQEGNFSIIISAAKRRFFRLFIPVGFVIFLSFLLLHFSMYKHIELSKVSHSDWWLGTLWPVDNSFGTFMEFFTYRVMFLGDSNYDTSMWTMSMELFGSFLVFGALVVTHLTKYKNIIFLIILLLLYAAEKYYYTAFMFGMMLYSVEQFSFKVKGPLLSFIVIPVLFFGGLLLGSFPSLAWSHYSWWDFVTDQNILNHYVIIHVIGSVMLVVAVILSPSLQKILGSRIFIFLGLISFSLYLIHPLVLGAFSAPLFLHFQESMGYNKAALMVLLSTIGLTVILSYIMAMTVDRFSLSFTKKYLGNASDKRKPTPVKVAATQIDEEEEPMKRKKKKKKR